MIHNNVMRELPLHDRITAFADNFKELRDRDLANLMIELTDNTELQNAVRPLISSILLIFICLLVHV